MAIEERNFETAIAVHVILPGANIDSKDSLDELTSLANAAEVEVVGYVRQKRRDINASLYVGRGKAEEIAQFAQLRQADVVIFDNDLSPAQIRELEKIMQVKVIDRSELILDIFARRASSAEARMQVELAQLEYTYPRLTRMWSHLDTVTGGAATGGVGTRGTGESQLEIDRRLVSKRVSQLKSRIAEIDKRKSRQAGSRNSHFTVSLVGYTNAGKSTLMNTLTGSDTYSADQLFATLDTKTSRWTLDGENYALLSDTVGFVRDLPHHLVASFRATLEETIHADLLLHVLDVSHSHVFQQVEAVNTVLAELGCDQKDVLLVANKMDKPGAVSKFEEFSAIYPDAICVSSKTGDGLGELIENVLKRVTGTSNKIRITCPYNNGKVLPFLKAYGQVISEDYCEAGTIIEASIGANQMHNLLKLQPFEYELI